MSESKKASDYYRGGGSHLQAATVAARPRTKQSDAQSGALQVPAKEQKGPNIKMQSDGSSIECVQAAAWLCGTCRPVSMQMLVVCVKAFHRTEHCCMHRAVSQAPSPLVKGHPYTGL